MTSGLVSASRSSKSPSLFPSTGATYVSASIVALATQNLKLLLSCSSRGAGLGVVVDVLVIVSFVSPSWLMSYSRLK